MDKNKIIENEKGLAGKRIGVFGKGGSGKSTVVVLLARVLRQRGYEVCVLDADSTNIGMPGALGIDIAPKTLIDYFGGMVFSGGLVTCPVDDPTPLPGAEFSLDELPSEFYAQNQDGITLLEAGKIGDQGPGAGCDGPISKVARDIKILQNGEQPVTLVDFKAGFEDSARGVITSLDWAVVVVDPTVAAVEMAANMKDMVRQIKDGVLPATDHLESPELVEWANKIFGQAKIKDVSIVLNNVRDEETEEYLQSRLAEKGIEPVGVIHAQTAISISWLKGLPIVAPNTQEEVSRIVDALEAAVNLEIKT
jgi:CO dehydrogenase nickel-insertion accessory protein CooC1